MKLLRGLVVFFLGLGVVRPKKLQILHSSDNESSFVDPNSLEEKVIFYAALVVGLQQLAANEGTPSVHITAGDHVLPGPFYQASQEVPSLGQNGLADIGIYNAFPNIANGIGNHEFDGGINEFAVMLAAANYPFLSVNLDFSNVQTSEETPPIAIGPDASLCDSVAGMVTKSCYIDLGDDFLVGVIGRSPDEFFNVIEDPDVNLPGLEFVGGRDNETNTALLSAIPMVNEQVALLEAMGVNVIVLSDHAQDWTTDPLSANELRGIDVIVAAGASGFQASTLTTPPFNFLRPADEGNRAYPVALLDSENKTVLSVNSEQLYKYIGHLIVEFDDGGEVVTWDMDRSGPIATTSEAVDLLRTYLNDTSLMTIPEVRTLLDELLATPTIMDTFEEIGTTSSALIGERADVRSRETNLGRIAADSTLWQANNYPNVSVPVDVALKNGGGIRDSITGPAIIRLTIRSALAFDNTLTIVELTGGQMIAAMENSVSRFPSLDGRFPHVSGMMLEFDESKPGVQGSVSLETPSRIKTLVITKAGGMEDTLISNYQAQGDLSRTFVMATNSFLATGGDGYSSFDAGNFLGETDIGEQEILEKYIEVELGGVVDVADPPPNARVAEV